MDTPNEIWQIEVDGAQYEADTDTLKQWIIDGYVAPTVKVQKGSLKWIEIQRVPTFRNLFSGSPGAPPPAPEPVDRWASAPEHQEASHDYAPSAAAPAADTWAPPSQYGPTTSAGFCVNHPAAATKYVCQSCGASLCTPCTKRYGNVALCTLCGQMCKPYKEAVVEAKKQTVLGEGFGLRDFALAVQYPLKDPLALALTAVLYGLLSLFGIYGRIAASGLLFGYISHAIRRVSMGYIDEGPSPDLSDPADLIFEAFKLGVAIALVTFGPLVAVILWGFGSGFSDLTLGDLLTTGIGMVLGLLWALFYYPMALLVGGYTSSFVATANPLVGLATMTRLGLDYVKAYVMLLGIYILQTIAVAILGNIGEGFNAINTLMGAVGYLVQYILQGAVWFYASMVMAGLLGLLLYKRPDVVDVDA